MIEFSAHSEKQERVIFNDARIVCAATGIQWGKTKSGAMWLKMMMHTHCSPSDNFLITSPTFPILRQSTLPPFLEAMQGLGQFNKQENAFKMYGGGTCYMRTNQNPDSVVGITNVRAILCDEAGLYTLYFWQNILGRSSFCQAPIRIVTSPYSQNWLYKDYIRKFEKDPTLVPGFDYIKAASYENPYFPRAEYEERKQTMDPRRFNMMYGGQFERMIGLVYDCFHHDENISRQKQLPPGTRYVGGIDWGTTNPFALMVRGITPAQEHYGLGEFYKTGMTLSDMKQIAKQYMSMHGIEKYYADPAMPAYIEEFNRDGIPCEAANNDIDLGIQAHYELIATRRYQVMEGRMPHMLDELETYHYSEPKDVKPDQDEKAPKPVKQNDHAMDAERYITIMTYKGLSRHVPKVPKDEKKLTGPAYDFSILKNRNKKTESFNW